MASLVRLGGSCSRARTTVRTCLERLRETPAPLQHRSKASKAGTSSLQPGNSDEATPKPLQKPRNESIPFSFVRLVNRETGSLDAPARLHDILRSVNRKKEYLELVVDKPEPIVKVINTALQYDRKKQKLVQHAQNRAPDEKEMQLTWGVGTGDLQAKLNKVRDELVDGNRVTLVFAPKKGQPVPRSEEQMKIVEEAVRLLEDVSKERQERAVQPQIIAIFLESSRPRKQVHELAWAYEGDEPWVGLKAVQTALRKGARVEATFSLIHPPVKKTKKDESSDLDTPRIPEPEEIRRLFDKTMGELSALGKEWRPRDTRRNTVKVYMEGIRVT